VGFIVFFSGLLKKNPGGCFWIVFSQQPWFGSIYFKPLPLHKITAQWHN